MTAKHTALPLTASTVWAQGNGETSANFVLDANGKTVAWAAKPEDAALIVQAVNERDGLVRDAERLEAVRKRVRELWQTVKVYNRAVAGSFDRGRDCGMEDALRSIETAMGSLQIKPMDAAIDAAKGVRHERRDGQAHKVARRVTRTHAGRRD